MGILNNIGLKFYNKIEDMKHNIDEQRDIIEMDLNIWDKLRKNKGT